MSIEAKVTEIWNSVLNDSSGQTESTFFDLGGDSISAVRLITRVEDELDVQVDVGDIFEDNPTLDDFIRTVDSAKFGQVSAH